MKLDFRLLQIFTVLYKQHSHWLKYKPSVNRLLAGHKTQTVDPNRSGVSSWYRIDCCQYWKLELLFILRPQVKY